MSKVSAHGRRFVQLFRNLLDGLAAIAMAVTYSARPRARFVGFFTLSPAFHTHAATTLGTGERGTGVSTRPRNGCSMVAGQEFAVFSRFSELVLHRPSAPAPCLPHAWFDDNGAYTHVGHIRMRRGVAPKRNCSAV